MSFVHDPHSLIPNVVALVSEAAARALGAASVEGLMMAAASRAVEADAAAATVPAAAPSRPAVGLN